MASVALRCGESAGRDRAAVSAAQNASLEGVREIEETRFVTTYSDSQDERFISEDGDDSYAVVGFEVSENQTQELVDRVIDGRLRPLCAGAIADCFVLNPPSAGARAAVTLVDTALSTDWHAR